MRQLQQAIVSHTVVDQAIGVVIALGGLTPDQGWAVLKEVSQHTNTKLREISGQVVAWTYGGELPDDTRQALDIALLRARSLDDRDSSDNRDSRDSRDGKDSTGGEGGGRESAG
ncbi:ANTAR domain-containing protein [Streptomyces sp. NPDC057694]|uniref:ANTAR domain-containing protein n=1 Tax=Streptomyces sp. NPDC057694 TaxID=3346216 RepID=UPI0036C18296